jgi:hypothetical protein
MADQATTNPEDALQTSSIASNSTSINTTPEDIISAINAICADLATKSKGLTSPVLRKSVRNPKQKIATLTKLIPKSILTSNEAENNFLFIGQILSNQHLTTVACCIIYLGTHCPKKFADPETSEGKLNGFLQEAAIQYTTLCLGKNPSELLSLQTHSAPPSPNKHSTSKKRNISTKPQNRRARGLVFFPEDSRPRAQSTSKLNTDKKQLRRRSSSAGSLVYYPNNDYIPKRKGSFFQQISKKLRDAFHSSHSQHKHR